MSLAMVGGRLAVAAGDFSLCLSECLLRDDDENTPFLDDKLKRLSDKIKQLKTAITQSSVNSQTPSTPTNPITAKDLLITEYDDMLTARIIEKIIVKSRQDLEIIFIGGYTQQISLQ